MKKLFFLLIFVSCFFQAQELEDLQEGYFFAESSRNFFRVDIKKPYDYYRVDSCPDNERFIRAQFEGGDANFNRELFKYISAYVDKEIYFVNGTFYMNISINRLGRITHIDIVPKVENSEMFLKDLKFAVRKIKNTWTPSKCGNTAVDSKLRIKLNFVSENVDL